MNKLMMEVRILAFLFFKLNNAEIKYIVREREAFVMVKCLKEIRP